MKVIRVENALESLKYQEKLKKYHHQNFSLILKFACDVAKDELEKHPEMRTIAMVELENNFPSDFSAKVLKCLPEDVNKVVFNQHTHVYKNITLRLPRESMLIYIADKLSARRTFLHPHFLAELNFSIVRHLSKHLIVSSSTERLEELQIWALVNILNIVHTYEEKGKVVVVYVDLAKYKIETKRFEGWARENLSQVVFPDKLTNLRNKKLHAVYTKSVQAHPYKGSDKPNCKWTPYLDIIADKFNSTMIYTRIPGNYSSFKALFKSATETMRKLNRGASLDFYLNYGESRQELVSYNGMEWCLVAPIPDSISITAQILFLPMDKSCWMWLGITIAVSTLIWRVSEGHWGFAFGAFSYFVDQAQLIIRIRTNRLTMKILLQLLIFTFFIFSNGYQSLITSFMLEPQTVPLLKLIDEVLDSDLNIAEDDFFGGLNDENPKYNEAAKTGRVVEFGEIVENWWEKVVDKKIVYRRSCMEIKNLFTHEGDGKSYRGVYQIPEVIGATPEELYTQAFHPYLAKFQDLMDRSFEAGLHVAWERFYWEKWREMHHNRTQIEENEILDLGLIAPFFLILAVGFVASLLTLLCEIFHRDFISELSKEYFKKKFDNIVGKNVKKSKVRKTKVKPSRRRHSK